MSVLKRVDWLIGSSVLAAVALTWAVLVGLDALIILMNQLGQVGKGSYTLATAFEYVAWTLPRRSVEMFGYGAAIGGVLGLGALAPTSELTAMRAGGMSKLRISLAGAVGIGTLLLGVLVIGETLGPYGEARAQALVAGARSRDLVATGKTGLWAREGDTLINARGGTLGPDGLKLNGLRIYEFDQIGALLRMTMAQSAEHRDGKWKMQNVSAFRFQPEKVETTTLAEAPWNTDLDPRLLSVSIIKPDYLALRDIGRSIGYLERNRLDASVYRAAYWARVFYPLDVLALAFASLPFAFGALRSGGFGKRLFLGIVLAIGWFFSQRAMVNVAQVYGVDMRIAHLLPLLCLGAGAHAWFKRTA